MNLLCAVERGPWRSPSLLHRGEVWTLKGLPSVLALGTGSHRDERELAGKAAWPPLPLPSHQLAMDVSILSYESQFWPRESPGGAHTALWGGALWGGAAGSLARGHRGQAFTPSASPQPWEAQAQRQLSEEVEEASLEFTFPADQVQDWSFFYPQETCPHPVITCLTLHTWGVSALVHQAHIKVSQTFFSFTWNFRTSLRGAKQKGYLLYYIIEKCRGGLCLGQSWPQLSPRLPTVRLWYPPSGFLLRPAFSHHLAKVVCIVQ